MSAPDLENERQSPARQWGEVLLIVLVFFIAAGDPTPSVNETHYVCRLKHYWNPQWCAGDLFLESTDTQVVFIWLFGWLTRFFSLSATAWIGRLAAWFLQAWAWQRLSWRLVPRPLASVLSAALFLALNYYCQMAGEWVVGGVEAKCFAYAFVLLALSELVSISNQDSYLHDAYVGVFRWRLRFLSKGAALNQRWSKGCILLGAAIAFHPLVGGWSALVCAVMWLIYGRREQSFVSMLPGIIMGSLLAL